ncbi:MAG: PAS domain-containing protein, partial [Alphaproteobacteria bacterium]
FRSSIGHARLKDLYDYWDRLRGTGSLPPRGAFDPLHIPQLLPNIILNEVVGVPPRFRIRVEGSAVSAARGFDATGRFLDEPGVIVLRGDPLGAYAGIVMTGAPWYCEGSFSESSGRAGRLFRLALPLGGDDGAVRFILVGFFHELTRAPSARS